MRLVFALGLSLVLALSGCCTLSGPAEKAVRDAIAVNQGHQSRAGMHKQAVEVAQDNEDFLWVILYESRCIDELPEGVRGRKEGRDEAAKADDGGGE